MKISHSKIILTFSVIILILILILDVVFTNLLLAKIYHINDKIKQLNISTQEREKELNLKDSIASSVEERGRLSEYFVRAGDAETLEFTKYLEDLAKEMGVTQSKSLSYEPITELGSSETLSAIRFKFYVYGRWSDVYNFIQVIENLPKVSIVNNISLNLSPDKGFWSADLDFSVAKLKN